MRRGHLPAIMVPHRSETTAMQTLPDYAPPLMQRTHLAVAMAPMIVLLTFTLIVVKLVDSDTGFAIFAACTIWIVHEMTDYQRRIDAYNEGYVQSHLAWRSSEALAALVHGDDTHPPTRDFVRRFLDAGRVLRRDGPSSVA
jgi:hypothetical protein